MDPFKGLRYFFLLLIWHGGLREATGIIWRAKTSKSTQHQDQEKILQPFYTFISKCIHIDRPEAPEAAEWFELAARAVQVGNQKWPGGDFDRKNYRNWVRIGPFGMKKRSVNAQRRGESIGPPFSGLKLSKNNEKSKN